MRQKYGVTPTMDKGCTRYSGGYSKHNKETDKRNEAACRTDIRHRDKQWRKTRSTNSRERGLMRGRWTRRRAAARPLSQVLVNRLARGDPAAGGLAPGDTPGANQGLGAGNTALEALCQFWDGDLLGWSCFFHNDLSSPQQEKTSVGKLKSASQFSCRPYIPIIAWMPPMSNGPFPRATSSNRSIHFRRAALCLR